MKREKDIAYSAGIFDGEGHIHLNSGQMICIRIVNTSKELIDYLTKVWGGKVYTRKNQRTYDFIIIRKDEIMDFVEAVYPYLIVKKDQVDKVFEMYKLSKGYPFDRENHKYKIQ